MKKRKLGHAGQFTEKEAISRIWADWLLSS